MKIKSIEKQTIEKVIVTLNGVDVSYLRYDEDNWLQETHEDSYEILYADFGIEKLYEDVKKNLKKNQRY